MIPLQIERLYNESANAKQALIKVQNALHTLGRTIIGITGGPGSGKSTFADYIAGCFSKQQNNLVISLSMDGFHLSKAELNALPNSKQAFARRGAPWTFNSLAFAKRVSEISKSYQQKDVLWPSFDHCLGDPVNDNICIKKDTKVVLIEGLYLLQQQDGWQAAKNFFNEHWFLDIPLEVAIERLTKRHMKVWNLSREQAVQRIMENDGLNAELVVASKDRADWIFEG